jgi:hypothetical protein
MRPNLSFENLAAVLAALGTSAIVGCGGAAPRPVQASEVKPAANVTTTTTTTVSTPAAMAATTKPAPGPSTAQAPREKPRASGEASCGAGACSGSAAPKVR